MQEEKQVFSPARHKSYCGDNLGVTIMVAMADLGTLVRKQRRTKGMTQTALADKIGAQVKTIHNLERGATRNVKMKFRQKLAEVLDIPLATIMAADSDTQANDLRVTIPADIADKIRAWMIETDCRDADSAVMFLIGVGLGATRGPEDRRRKSTGRDPRPTPPRRKLKIGVGDAEYEV
jgi:transcriptional regulator with XRE-family HTH domain